MSIQQVFIKKKTKFDVVSSGLKKRVESNFKESVDCTVYYLYEVQGLTNLAFEKFKNEILGDVVTDEIICEIDSSKQHFAYTLLRGQFDQRAYYAIQAGKLILDHSSDFQVKSGTVVVFNKPVSDELFLKIKKLLINPVEARERELEVEEFIVPEVKEVKDISDFKDLNDQELMSLAKELGIFMDLETLKYIQKHYKDNNIKAKEAELFLFDTYWSDHCRHTTFLTNITSVEINGKYKEEITASFDKYLKQREEINRQKPVTLMDLATHNARYKKVKGRANNVEESSEINACSVFVEDQNDKYLLMFKNETHNHPTEIEPFGGAQTCLGGAIRDPLSGRSYVFQGIRITGAANPLTPFEDTLANKLPQKVICRDAAKGFSSYGNQIGLPTTFLREIYHPSYVAKRLELGAVVGLTSFKEIVREEPVPGDLVFLLGGKTGKDGIGGASGSSVSHSKDSLDTSYAQIQKGNPLEERKLQRLFLKPEIKKIIKKSNDFGAGGVSVAIGELADGIEIYLDRVPLKTTNMNTSEIAISESQERMAIVVDKKDKDILYKFAQEENVEVTEVALVTEEAKLVMKYGEEVVVDIERSFLDTNGPLPSQAVEITDYESQVYEKEIYRDLNKYSQKGLQEIFDSSVGYSTVLAPYGGKNQTTPEIGSVQRFSLNDTSDMASIVTYGFDPTISEESPYKMGISSVISSVAKSLALGVELSDMHLSFQEYFPKLKTDEKKWGLVLQSLLGAFEASDQLGLAAIGGKDSMSGTYEEIDVIPTLVSFAFAGSKIKKVRQRSFQNTNEYIYYLPNKERNGLPLVSSLLENTKIVNKNRDVITSISTTCEGVIQTLNLMSLGNDIGYQVEVLDEKNTGGYLFTSSKKIEGLNLIGKTIIKENNDFADWHLNGLQTVYPFTNYSDKEIEEVNIESKKYYKEQIEEPRALIVTFSGTNSELDMEKNFRMAGAKTKVFVVNDLTQDDFDISVDKFVKELQESHIFVIPGGFSFSDEPDGSGKYIATFLKQEKVRYALNEFAENGKLILGICNGFQGLIKSGLLPLGEVKEITETSPTLFFNEQYHHVSKMVKTEIKNKKSPWLQDLSDDEYVLPVSHSEGRFIVDEDNLEELRKEGLIATVYSTEDNPNGSTCNIEGIISKNGNIFGKMAHNERSNNELFINVPGNKRQDIFTSGVNYFKHGGQK